MRPLKIMYLDPLPESRANLRLFADMAAAAKLPETQVHVASLPDSAGLFRHLEYRSYEAVVTTAIVRATRAAAAEGVDAMVIGCFYDTALHDARELSGSMAVTAPCLASCEIAASLANRFGIIVGRQKWVDQMTDNVRAYGHGDRLSGFYPVGLGVTDFRQDHGRTAGLLLAAGRRAVMDDHAEALILGCTLETGFDRVLSAELGVPVIDPAIAALKRAEYAAVLRRDCGWKPSRKWSCEPPPESDLNATGAFAVAGALGARIVIPARPDGTRNEHRA